MVDSNAFATHLSDPGGTAAPAAGEGAGTRSAQISIAIRRKILGGVLQPGTRLRLEDLRAEFDVSWSPLRESISRLVAEGLIVSDEGRAYRIAPISRQELQAVLEIRLMLEAKALRASIGRGDDAWERELVATHHHLRKLEEARWSPGQLEEWEAWHQRFHIALISSCHSPLLMQYCMNLHAHSDRYRRLFLAAHPRDRDVKGEHEAIIEATLRRDADRACELLEAHVRRSLETILQAMPSDALLAAGSEAPVETKVAPRRGRPRGALRPEG